MSSDDNSEAPRAPSRDSRPSNASPRDHSAPILPPLRALNSRRPQQMLAASAIASARRMRPVDLHPHRLQGPGGPSPTEGDDFTLDSWDPWEYDLSGEQLQPDHSQHHPGSGTNVNTPSRSSSHATTPSGDAGSSNTRSFFDYSRRDEPLFTSQASRSAQHQEPHEENRRAKRRKVDTDRLSTNFQGFQYGTYGQVEPGHLKMELVSCDGGMYADDTTTYAAENILKNDASVYCTEGPRCNIVLRHLGATPFTLKELVIKAPSNNFTSPVQAGMVFVAMSSDHLLNRTAQYQIQYALPRTSSRRRGRDLEPLHSVISIRHAEDGSTMTRAQVRARRLYEIGLDDEDSEMGVAQIPPEFNMLSVPFQVTTECSEDEGDEANDRVLNGRAPNRIGSLPFENDTSDDAESDDFSLSRPGRRARHRRNRSGTALAEVAEAAQVATQEAVRAVGGELMTPYARFYIERHKSKCTIHFNPPVSGRYILLKMWNPHRGAHANIDIQAVIAKGFAGPRFFPCVELR
ncbi:hypothetical protein F5Y17DRAFT_450771 [Xylariaceae sp. FL0594]|nr:hypothetical protein F5Y17DRAFT_450771 [Xylariaceae sp. FL0594]